MVPLDSEQMVLTHEEWHNSLFCVNKWGRHVAPTHGGFFFAFHLETPHNGAYWRGCSCHMPVSHFTQVICSCHKSQYLALGKVFVGKSPPRSHETHNLEMPALCVLRHSQISSKQSFVMSNFTFFLSRVNRHPKSPEKILNLFRFWVLSGCVLVNAIICYSLKC